MKRSMLCALTLFITFGCGLNSKPGDGDKIGQVIRLSRVGIFRDTWEGQLIRGGMTGGSGVMGVAPFDFTIEDPVLVEKARKFMEDQTEVVIHWRCEGVYSACRSSSGGDFLTSIEPAVKR